MKENEKGMRKVLTLADKDDGRGDPFAAEDFSQGEARLNLTVRKESSDEKSDRDRIFSYFYRPRGVGAWASVRPGSRVPYETGDAGDPFWCGRFS
jgi:hypothetical protein